VSGYGDDGMRGMNCVCVCVCVWVCERERKRLCVCMYETMGLEEWVVCVFVCMCM